MKDEKIVIEKLSCIHTKPSGKVKMILLGLTPGSQQHEAINKSKSIRESAFKGYMRTQIHEWLIELGIARELELKSKDSLFTDKRFKDFIFISSLLRNPVYVLKNGKKNNYSGRSPYPWKHDDLKKLMDTTLSILDTIENHTLIVPMGQVVSKSLKIYSNLDKQHYILHGFPHPSGANINRRVEFHNNRKELKIIVDNYFQNNTIYTE